MLYVPYGPELEAVSNNQYDVNGLMSLRAMLNPEAALGRAELLWSLQSADAEYVSGLASD